MYMGQTSVYTSTFPFEKDANCIVCSSQRESMVVSGDKLLKDFRDEIQEKFSLSNPGLTAESSNKTLYISGPLGKKTKANLELTMSQLVSNEAIAQEDVIQVTDKLIPTVLNLSVKIE